MRITTPLDQSRLNIENRTRTSRLPWRGQFSPELIEYLVRTVCPTPGVLLDPFCGSGTVLFEGLSAGHDVIGCEINPAAWHFAKMATCANTTPAQANDLISQLAAVSQKQMRGPLFQEPSEALPAILSQILDADDEMLANALASSLLLAMGNTDKLSASNFARATSTVRDIVAEMSTIKNRATCMLSDARQLCLESESVDAVITSPPYINVFNYHQNFRPAVECLGWQPLDAARSEIGANRKHRMNRFLTVIQYCLDMALSITELSRVMRRNAPLIIVLGRTSSVLGAQFENGELIRRILHEGGGFSEIHSAERVFVSRFGERIFEDILVARRERQADCDLDQMRAIGMTSLRGALEAVPDKNRQALLSALERGVDVAPSQLLSLAVPAPFGQLPSLERRHAS